MSTNRAGMRATTRQDPALQVGFHRPAGEVGAANEGDLVVDNNDFRVLWDDEHFVRFTRSTVADLRANYARYPGDPEIESLVSEMLALSPPFAQMWNEYDVEVRGPMLKIVNHPQLGRLEFECQVLHVAETGQRIIAYCAAPGSSTEAAFIQLAAETARG